MHMFVYIIRAMNFTWKETKRLSNLKKHRQDFTQVEQVFAGPTMTDEDRRNYQGEQRFNTMGLLGVQVVVITHTETEDQIHIISMREAENHETRKFFSYI